MYGPSRTTVEKVVAIAKMSPGIVRFYFDSKAAMLVASLQFLAAEFEERLLAPVGKLKATPVAALELMVDLYLDPDIASPRKVSVWYAFWGEASSRQEYYDICGQKDESFASLVRELIEGLIAAKSLTHLDPDGVALGLIGVLEIMWQDFAFRTERDIDRAAAKKRCMAYLRSVFPGSFAERDKAACAVQDRSPQLPAAWVYDDARTNARERDELFREAWMVVGHESQLTRSNDFLTLDTGADRALVVREPSGGLQALRNSCSESPHLLVAARSGHFAAAIECKLHGLTYSLGGRCRGVRGADLSSLAVASAGGLIFVRPLDAARPANVLPADLGPTPDALRAWAGPSERRVAADWKVVVEQWLEAAALEGPLSCTGDVMTWQSSCAESDNWSARYYRRLGPGVAPHRWRRQFLAPNQLVETRPDGLSVIQVLPVAPGGCRVRRLDYTVLPIEAGARAVLFVAGRLGAQSRRATFDLVESIQRGMIDFGYAAAAREHSPAVAWFRDWLTARLPA